MGDIQRIALPKHIADALVGLVDIAKERKAVTLNYQKRIEGDGYVITDLGKGRRSGKEIGRVGTAEEDYILGLETLGFVVVHRSHDQRGHEYGHLFLTDKAYAWVHYYRRGKISRWWLSTTEWGKQAAPLLVAIAAVVLTILQIIQAVLGLL